MTSVGAAPPAVVVGVGEPPPVDPGAAVVVAVAVPGIHWL